MLGEEGKNKRDWGGGVGGWAFIRDVRVHDHDLWKNRLKTRLKGSKQFHYSFIIFIFDMYYSFFIGSGSFAIVERVVYDSTPIVLKQLH